MSGKENDITFVSFELTRMEAAKIYKNMQRQLTCGNMKSTGITHKIINVKQIKN
jgi:hypothetical protein